MNSCDSLKEAKKSIVESPKCLISNTAELCAGNLCKHDIRVSAHVRISTWMSSPLRASHKRVLKDASSPHATTSRVGWGEGLIVCADDNSKIMDRLSTCWVTEVEVVCEYKVLSSSVSTAPLCSNTRCEGFEYVFVVLYEARRYLLCTSLLNEVHMPAVWSH